MGVACRPCWCVREQYATSVRLGSVTAASVWLHTPARARCKTLLVLSASAASGNMVSLCRFSLQNVAVIYLNCRVLKWQVLLLQQTFNGDHMLLLLLRLLLLRLLHPFNGLCFRTTWVSRYQKGNQSRFKWGNMWSGLEMQWHQLDHMQSAPCSRHINTSSLNFYRPDALPSTQPCPSTVGSMLLYVLFFLSVATCRLAYDPADATATHCLLLQ